MNDDRLIDIVRATRDAYQNGVAEGERRAAARIAELEARLAAVRTRRGIVRRFALVVLCLGSGCFGPPDPINREVDAPAHVESAVELARDVWTDAVGEGFDIPEIRWFEGDCLRYEGESGGCVGGRTWHHTLYPTEIHGLVDHADLVIAHELLHVALLARDGDGDSDHSDDLWTDVDPLRVSVRDVLDPDAAAH